MKNRLSRILAALLLVLCVAFSCISCDDVNSETNGGENSELNGGSENTDQGGSSDSNGESEDIPDQGGNSDSNNENDNENQGNVSNPNEDNKDPTVGDNTGSNEDNKDPTVGDNTGSNEDNKDPEIGNGESKPNPDTDLKDGFDLSKVPEYSGEIFCQINGNVPYFTEEDLITDSYETYGNLDSLGRCTTAMACVGLDIMPTEPRGDISSVTPTGWVQRSYSVVKGGYLYNRCHLIGFQLTGENDNNKNLITGTRELNNEGMLPFENMIADYIKETGNHVIYRVTPIFEGNELLARGVLLEAYSVEDEGEGISLNVFIYNVQPNVVIDYATGNSELAEGVEEEEDEEPPTTDSGATFVINVKTKKYHTVTHYPNISDYSNLEYTTKTEAELLAEGYVACLTCKP